MVFCSMSFNLNLTKNTDLISWQGSDLDNFDAKCDRVSEVALYSCVNDYLYMKDCCHSDNVSTIPCSTKYHLFPANSTKYHLFPANYTKYHLFPANSTTYHLFPANSSKYHLFPDNSF